MTSTTAYRQGIWDHHGSYQWTYFNESIKQLISFYLSPRLSGPNLEVGGGWYLSYPNSSVIDFSPVCLEYNPAKEKRVFDLDDIAEGKQLPFPDKSFNSATLISVWQYLQSPKAVMKELERVLTPGAEVYIIGGEGAGLQECIRQATTSIKIVNELREWGYDTLVEHIPLSREIERFGKFNAVCVAMPGEPLFPSLPSKIRNRTRRVKINEEMEENKDIFLDEYVEQEMKLVWQKFNQLRTYPVTAYSQDALRQWHNASNEYFERTGEQVILYADELPMFIHLLQEEDHPSVTQEVDSTSFLTEKDRFGEIIRDKNLRSIISSRFSEKRLEKVVEGEEILPKAQHSYDKESSARERKTIIDELLEFCIAIPLNQYTKDIQNKTWQALKRETTEQEDIGEKYHRAIASKLFFLFTAYKQRRRIDKLIARKKELEQEPSKIIGTANVTFTPFLRYFPEFIKESI